MKIKSLYIFPIAGVVSCLLFLDQGSASYTRAQWRNAALEAEKNYKQISHKERKEVSRRSRAAPKDLGILKIEKLIAEIPRGKKTYLERQARAQAAEAALADLPRHGAVELPAVVLLTLLEECVIEEPDLIGPYLGDPAYKRVVAEICALDIELRLGRERLSAGEINGLELHQSQLNERASLWKKVLSWSLPSLPLSLWHLYVPEAWLEDQPFTENHFVARQVVSSSAARPVKPRF